MKVGLVLDDWQRKDLKVCEEWKIETNVLSRLVDIIIHSNNIFWYFSFGFWGGYILWDIIELIKNFINYSKDKHITGGDIKENLLEIYPGLISISD